MEQLIRESLSKIVDEDLCDDLAQYILSVQNENDFEDYMRTLFDLSIKEQKESYDKIKNVKFGKKGKSKLNINDSSSKSANGNQIQEQMNQQQTTSDSAKKKTKKFRKFQLSELHKGYLRQGRFPCECQATKHKLINNCIDCGRIICEQEGSGPCFFCDSMVCTKEEQEILNSDSLEGDALYRTLTDRKTSETWKKAIDSRNKLLHFDKTATQQTKIIDDEHDYYSINNRWSSGKEREKAVKRLEKDQEQRHGSRLGARNIMLDLIGREVREQAPSAAPESDSEDDVQNQQKNYNPVVPDITSLLESLKIDKANFKDKGSNLGLTRGEQGNSKPKVDDYVIQDASYIGMRDRGVCLSMHQPWASLLVHGIKQHEGRTWYTPHRGTLWIASTNKQAETDVIHDVEDFYRNYYGDPELVFPDQYPVGCLLGRVILDDCMMQDEYREQYPAGESESPYVFVCSDPHKLMVSIPMKGEHKIYKLHTAIHTMARDALLLKKRLAS